MIGKTDFATLIRVCPISLTASVDCVWISPKIAHSDSGRDNSTIKTRGDGQSHFAQIILNGIVACLKKNIMLIDFIDAPAYRWHKIIKL